MADQIMERPAKITLEFHTGIDELLMDIDPEKLMQILSNLMSNAVKYTPEGGKIQMRVDTHETKEKNELIIKLKTSPPVNLQEPALDWPSPKK